MKFLIIFAGALAFAAAGNIHAPIAYSSQHLPVIGANGVPVDTPAVQHATASHLGHKAEAHARNGDFAVYGHAAYGNAAYDHAAPVVSSYAAYSAAPVVSTYAAAPAYAHAAPVVAAYAAQPAAYPTTAVLPQSVNGVPQETPEVVAATSNHFAAHAEANARNAVYAPEVAAYSTYSAAPFAASTYAHAAPVVAAYAAQPAAYPTTAVLPQSVNGVPQETPEVVAATSNHFAAHAEANARNGNIAVYAPEVSAYSTYSAAPFASTYAHAAPVVAAYAAQPAAYPTTAVLPQSFNGVPQETPEVVAATSNHFAAHAEANARNGNIAIVAPVVSAYAAAPLVSTYAHAAPVVAAYAGHHHAAAYPTTAVLPQSVNGVPLETPEVVAAKANHFAAHAEAKAANHNRWRRGVAYGAQHLPVIGANGVPIDTAEVQQATAAHLAHKVEAHARNGDFAYSAPAYAYSGYAHASPAVSAYSAFPYSYGNAAYGYGYSSPFARYY